MFSSYIGAGSSLGNIRPHSSACRSSVKLHQLKALDALEQTGSFSGAANCLGLTQPAVSIQLRKLQVHYGVKLFWRSGRKLKFSTFGKELVLKARMILGLIDDFEASLSSVSNLRSGDLKIGLSCHYLVMELLSVFMERYPGVQVKATIGDSANLIEPAISRLSARVRTLAPGSGLFQRGSGNSTSP